MKISPISSTFTPAAPTGAVESVRSLKMSVNRTPGRVLETETQDPVENAEAAPDTTETTAAVEATEPLSPQFAALAKQRRALQQERRAFDDQKKEFEAKSQGSDSVTKADLKSRPIEILLENGVSYDQLTEAIMANQGSSEINDLKAKIAALEQGVDKKFTDKETQAEKQVLAEMRKEAISISTESDDFELVRETESIDDVMTLIERTYRETGEVLGVTEALKLVEDELFARSQKLAKLKKMQSVFNPATQQVPQQRANGMRTLTNRDTASVPLGRRERALAAFSGVLKK